MIQIKLNNGIDYIKQNVSLSLANHVTTLIRGHELKLSRDLATGPGWEDCFLPTSSIGNRYAQQHALTALLLCQYVFLSDLWPRMRGTASTLQSINHLSLNWKIKSYRFWRNKIELHIRDALKMFVATTNNSDYFANAAQRWRPSCPSVDELLRTTARENFSGNPPSSTCYQAVMLWLFKSGLVSLPWLLKYRVANTELALTDAFGRGTIIWSGNFGSSDRLPPVPRGHIVHIFEHQSAWNGHWMVSLGDGRAVGVNNVDEDPPVPRTYCNNLNLNKQFLGLGGGTAIVIDPCYIPGRL